MPEPSDTQFDIRPGEDPYQVLDLPRTASEEDVRKAYFQQVRRFPPERAPDQFQQIRRAYEQLRLPERRKITDLFLLQTLPPRPNRRLPACDLDVHSEDLLVMAATLSARPLDEDFQPFETAS
jgi:curved DNA-binding protein CbpA